MPKAFPHTTCQLHMQLPAHAGRMDVKKDLEDAKEMDRYNTLFNTRERGVVHSLIWGANVGYQDPCLTAKPRILELKCTIMSHPILVYLCVSVPQGLTISI